MSLCAFRHQPQFLSSATNRRRSVQESASPRGASSLGGVANNAGSTQDIESSSEGSLESLAQRGVQDSVPLNNLNKRDNRRHSFLLNSSLLGYGGFAHIEDDEDEEWSRNREYARKVSLDDAPPARQESDEEDLDDFHSFPTFENQTIDPSSRTRSRKISLENDNDSVVVYSARVESRPVDDIDAFRSVGWSNQRAIIDGPRLSTSDKTSFVTAPHSYHVRSVSPTPWTTYTTTRCTTTTTTTRTTKTTVWTTPSSLNVISDDDSSLIWQNTKDDDVRSTPSSCSVSILDDPSRVWDTDRTILSNASSFETAWQDEKPDESFQCPTQQDFLLLQGAPATDTSASDHTTRQVNLGSQVQANDSSVDDMWCDSSVDIIENTSNDIDDDSGGLDSLSDTSDVAGTVTPPEDDMAQASTPTVPTSVLVDCTTATINRPTDQTVCVKDRVSVIGGTHKGKTGTVKKVTAKRIGVVLDGMATPRYLVPGNVKRILPPSSTGHDVSVVQACTTHRSAQQPPSLQGAELPNACDPLDTIAFSPGLNGENDIALNDDTIVHDAMQDIVTQPAVSGRSSDGGLGQSVESITESQAADGKIVDVNDPVDIIGGTHKGRRGKVIKITASRVHVNVDGIGVRYLSHDNVVKNQDLSCAVDQNTQGQPQPLRASSRTREPRSGSGAESMSQRSPVTRAAVPHVLRSSQRMAALPQDVVPQLEDSADGNMCYPIHTSLGLKEVCVTLSALGKVTQDERTLAFALFGHRIRPYEINLSKDIKTLPSQYTENDGSVYQLISSKLQRKKGCFSYSSIVKAQYILVAGRGLEPIDLKRQLEGWAAFGRLEPRKVAARLELLQTPALMRNDKPLLFSLCPSELEEIPEVAHEGCGFMPVDFAKKYFGNHAVGKRIFALQVRIQSSEHGLFKGVLVAKQGITKIQLPSSMRKVGPSETSIDNKAHFVIKGAFPSKTNVILPKLFNVNAKPPKSFCPKKLSSMFSSVLKSRGVPGNVVKNYREKSNGNQGAGLEHAFLIGLSDPTESIPSGHVFVTGFQSIPLKDTVLVSRFPCTEASDAHLLPILTSKPEGMSHENWDWLCSLDFGGIIFANPTRGDAPLPSKIANGDLDGDLYLICWHDPIISHFELSIFESVDAADATDEHVVPESQDDTPIWNESWLEEGQQLMGDVVAINGMRRLYSELHKQWQNATAKSSDDAVAFGRAYKLALDLGKHGGVVFLPKRLWTTISECYYPLLTEFEIS